MKPKNINNSLKDVSYFIKNNILSNENEGYLAKNFRIIELSNFKNSVLQKNKEIINKIENNENKINQNNNINTNINITKSNKVLSSPFSKISFNIDQNINNIYNYDIYNNFNNKRKIIANSITNTPSRNIRNIFDKSNSLNQKKNNNININFPFKNYKRNIRIVNTKQRKKYNYTIRINTNLNNNNLNECVTINLEKKNENDKIDKINNKKEVEIKSRNPHNIRFKFNGNSNKEQVTIYNSNHIIGNIVNINKYLNFDKFQYKNRKIFHEKYCKLNNIFSCTNSHKNLNNDSNKKEENNNFNLKNNEKKEEKKIEIIKNNNFTENSNSKKSKTENKENNSYSYDYRYNTKKSLKNKSKPNNLINIFTVKKFKIKPKLPPMGNLDKFIKPFESKENALKKYLSKELLPYRLNPPLNNSLLNQPIEKLYYTVNKMYRNQIPQYMKHRINWELVNLKKMSLEEQKNININFEWKYLSNRLNFKNYKYEPGTNLPRKKYRMVNLFERNYEIGNKRNMFINIISYCDKINLNAFDYVPFTITINYSKDLEQFLEALKEIMTFLNSKKINNQDLILNRKYSEQFWFDKNYDYLENQYIYINKNFLSNKNYWIIKPPDLYQGKCIEISNDFNEINKKCKNMFKGVNKTILPDLSLNLEEEDSDEEKNNVNTNANINNSIYNNSNIYKNSLQNNLNNSGSDIELKSEENLNNSSEIINNINLNSLNSIKNKKHINIKKKIYSRITCFNEIIVQKYLDNPLLYKKRKFDIRCYVLVDSNLNVFFCREGHLKGSSELYDINNTNKFIHITNHSLQKKSSKFEQYEYGNEMSYSDFKSFMQEENIPIENFNKMIEQMKYLVKISFKSVGNKLLRITPVLCFEIFGYDFILDNDFRPWILEINNNPGLGISSPVIEKLVPRMIDDALRLTIDKVFETKYDIECIDENGKYKSKYKLDGFSDEENVFEFLCNVG